MPGRFLRRAVREREQHPFRGEVRRDLSNQISIKTKNLMRQLDFFAQYGYAIIIILQAEVPYGTI